MGGGKRVEKSLCKSCSLLLVADNSFYKEVGEGNVRQTVLQMLYHVREANLLLRRQDYDRDGRQDCIGVHVAGIGVVTHDSSIDNLLNGTFPSPEHYLRTFSRYQLDGYCLALLFSSRVFPGKVLGLSWRGDEERHGGICQTRTVAPRLRGAGLEMLNLNSLFITLRTRRTKRIPLRMGVLNLAHELLHSFGAYHDPETSDCSAKDEKRSGRFLMSRFSSSGVKRNNERISNCTAAAVNINLAKRALNHCLVPVTAMQCGDGIVDREAGEECDCGSPERCLARRSTCVPPGLRRGETECRVRQARGGSSSKQCSRLGLQSCSCPPVTNSITQSRCTVCCQAKGERCLPAREWTNTLFTHMQRFLGRMCWHGGTVLNCISTSAKWSNTLTSLSLYKPDISGEVFCLQTQVDSNCWQLDFLCSSKPSKSKSYFTTSSSSLSRFKNAFSWAA